jgi:hypothetical protein
MFYFFHFLKHGCRCADLLGRMANPRQDRLAVQLPELRIQAVKQMLLEELMNQYVNNVQFTPHVIPDISHWFPNNNFDVNMPHEHRTWIWVSQKMHFIKAGMSSLMANFHQSGDNANDIDDHSRDLEFYQNFCHHQALWFWIYMCPSTSSFFIFFISFQTCFLNLFSSLRRCWDHGRNIPVYNMCLLPDDQRLECGTDADDKDGEDGQKRNTAVAAAATPTSKKRKTSSTVAAVAFRQRRCAYFTYSGHISSFVNHKHDCYFSFQVSHHLMTSQQQMLSSQASSYSSPSTSNLSPEQKRSSAMKELLDQAKNIRDALTIFSEEFNGDLKEALSGVSKQYLKCCREPFQLQDMTE